MKKPLALFAFALLSGCSGVSSNLDATPTNDLPNPYRTLAPWGKLPEGHAWGALNSVAVDNERGMSGWWTCAP